MLKRTSASRSEVGGWAGVLERVSSPRLSQDKAAWPSPIARQLTAATAANTATEANSPAAKAAGWLASVLKNKVQVAIAVGLGLVAANVAVEAGYHMTYKRGVLNKLAHGVLPQPQPPAVLPRDVLREEMRHLLHPEKQAGFYAVIAGVPGSGKTTMIRSICGELAGGVGYVEVSPACENFGRDLGEAFDFTLERQVGLFNVVSQAVLGAKTVELHGDRLGSLRRIAEALHDAAAEYRQQYGKPFVLVIDSVDRLRASQQDVLQALLKYAEEWAQDGVIATAFVTNEWQTFKELLGSHPAQSRAGAPLWVGDVSDEDAALYLAHLGVHQEAQQYVELLGGSMLLLERAAAMQLGGAKFDAVRSRLLELMAVEFQQAGLLSREDKGEAKHAWDALTALLQRKEKALTLAEWRSGELMPDEKRQDRLLASGILQFDGQRIAFASRLAHVYAAELLHASQRAQKRM